MFTWCWTNAFVRFICCTDISEDSLAAEANQDNNNKRKKKNKAQRFIEFVRPRYSLEIGLKASQQTDWRGCVYIFNCTRLLTIQDMALFSRSLIQRHRAVGEYLETQWWKNDQLPWKHWLRFISGRHWCKHHKWPISIWRHKFMYRKKTVKI